MSICDSQQRIIAKLAVSEVYKLCQGCNFGKGKSAE